MWGCLLMTLFRCHGRSDMQERWILRPQDFSSSVSEGAANGCEPANSPAEVLEVVDIAFDYFKMPHAALVRDTGLSVSGPETETHDLNRWTASWQWRRSTAVF